MATSSRPWKLLPVVVIAGCGSVDTHPGDPDAASFVDAHRSDAADPADAAAGSDAGGADAAPLGPWAAPARVDVVSTTGYVDSFPTVTDDRRQVFFVSDRDGGSQDIYVSIRLAADDPWGAPAKVTELDMPSSTDSGPDVSGDGKTIWFSSHIVGASPDPGMDLYTASRGTASEPWGAITPVTELNTAANERSPHVTADGRTMYFASDATGDYEIYAVNRPSTTAPWGTPHVVVRLSSTATDESTSTTADELEMFIDSRRDGANATYHSTKSPDGGAWSVPEPVAELAGCFRADVTGDGHYMVLSCLGDNGSTDVFETWR